MSKIKGYIVLVCGAPGVLHDYGDCPRGGVMTMGTIRMGAHLFPTRQKATTAIARTVRYARRKNLPWRGHDYQILSVRS